MSVCRPALHHLEQDGRIYKGMCSSWVGRLGALRVRRVGRSSIRTVCPGIGRFTGMCEPQTSTNGQECAAEASIDRMHQCCLWRSWTKGGACDPHAPPLEPTMLARTVSSRDRRAYPTYPIMSLGDKPAEVVGTSEFHVAVSALNLERPPQPGLSRCASRRSTGSYRGSRPESSSSARLRRAGSPRCT